MRDTGPNSESAPMIFRWLDSLVIQCNGTKLTTIERKTIEGENFCVSIQNKNFAEKMFVHYSSPANYYVHVHVGAATKF